MPTLPIAYTSSEFWILVLTTILWPILYFLAEEVDNMFFHAIGTDILYDFCYIFGTAIVSCIMVRTIIEYIQDVVMLLGLVSYIAFYLWYRKRKEEINHDRSGS